MSFLQLASGRYSCRKFMNIPVSESDIEKILEAGRVAPTAKNSQPQRIYVVSSADAIGKLKKCTECSYDCKTAFIICYDKNEVWTRAYDGLTSGNVDASIVATHMMLEAYDIGVGTTWVMYFDVEMVVNEFELPENIVPVAILVAGYPADKSEPSNRHADRKPLGETVTYL